MEDMLRFSVTRFPNSSHYVFLSGQDYPARPVSEFLDLLQRNPRKTWMHVYPMVQGQQFYNLAYDRFYIDFESRLHGVSPVLKTAFRKLTDLSNRHLPRRVPPVQLWRGSTSWCLSRDAALAILAFMDSEQGKQVWKHLSASLLADEIWAATALCNTAERESIVGTEGYFKEDPSQMIGERKIYHHYIDWSPEREDPALLHIGDLASIQESGAYWIRKVDSQKSKDLLTYLDEKVLD